MTHLQYKGLSSTRVRLGIIAALGVTVGYIWGDVTAQQWIDFLKWDLLGYMGSEVLTKGAIAMKRHNQDA